MKFNKPLVFLSAVMFFTQLSAKDLASEKEVMCSAFYNLYYTIASKQYSTEVFQNKDLAKTVHRWANLSDSYNKMSTDKYVNKIGVTKETLQGAYGRRVDFETDNFSNHFSAGATLNAMSFIKFGEDRERSLKCSK